MRPQIVMLSILSLGIGCNSDVGNSQVDAGPGQADAMVIDDCPNARIAVQEGGRLNVRPTANTDGAAVGALPNNLVVEVVGRVEGESISGNTEWFEVKSSLASGFISAAYAGCTTDDAPDLQPPDGFRIPLECGFEVRIAQGNDGGFSHQGRAFYAYDFDIDVDTPMTAMADGVVLYTFDETGPGDSCYNGGDSLCFPYANYVALVHGDGSASIYKHLNALYVTQGQFVEAGKVIGLSGSTGYSTGPHAHVMRQEECGEATSCQSIPLVFADVEGDGVPDKDQWVTSGNCMSGG